MTHCGGRTGGDVRVDEGEGSRGRSGARSCRVLEGEGNMGVGSTCGLSTQRNTKVNYCKNLNFLW